MAISVGVLYILTASATSAGAANVSGQTNGNSYTKVILENIRDDNKQDGQKNIYYGGAGYFFRYDKTTEIVRAKGYTTTRAGAKACKRFINKRQSAGNKPDYITYRYSSTEAFPFYNYDGTDKYGVGRGWLKSLRPQFTTDENQVYPVDLEFHVVWS